MIAEATFGIGMLLCIVLGIMFIVERNKYGDGSGGGLVRDYKPRVRTTMVYNKRKDDYQ